MKTIILKGSGMYAKAKSKRKRKHGKKFGALRLISGPSLQVGKRHKKRKGGKRKFTGAFRFLGQGQQARKFDFGGGLKSYFGAKQGSNMGARVAGMVAANWLVGAAGDGLAELLGRQSWTGNLFAETELGARRVKALLSLLGSAGLYALQGMHKLGDEALKGGSDILAFGFLNNLLGSFGGDQKLRQSLFSGVVGGQVGVSLLSKDDLLRKIDDLKKEQADLEGALGGVAGDLSSEQEAVYVSAAEHVAGVDGPLRAAQGLLSNGRMYEAGEAIKDAMSLAIVGRALLSGLTAGLAPAGAAQQPALSESLTVVDAKSGQAAQVPAPAAQEPQASQQGVSVPAGTKGYAINLDMLGPWASWVASQRAGWSPSEVATAFILKYLANNGHYYGFGPNAVVAMNNYGPGNISGYTNVSGASGAMGVNLAVAGQVYTVGGSPDEILATVGGIFERHLGSH